jgi:hypothetical protein
MLIKIPPQLAYKFPISPIIRLTLKRLILDHKVIDFAFRDLFQVAECLLRIVALVLQLRLYDVQLSLRFVEILGGPVNFLLFLVKFNSVSGFNVLLNLHPHDVSINRQAHFICHLIYFTLLLLNGPSHVAQPRLQPQL